MFEALQQRFSLCFQMAFNIGVARGLCINNHFSLTSHVRKRINNRPVIREIRMSTSASLEKSRIITTQRIVHYLNKEWKKRTVFFEVKTCKAAIDKNFGVGHDRSPLYRLGAHKIFVVFDQGKAQNTQPIPMHKFSIKFATRSTAATHTSLQKDSSELKVPFLALVQVKRCLSSRL
ncbi:hypothetical protein Tcan_00489, partial [Toxocara canis]